MAEYAIQTWVGSKANKRTGQSHPANFVMIEFEPALSDKVNSAEKIAIVQTCQILVDGNPVLPGTFYAAFVYRDADAQQTAGAPDYGTFVDYVAGETAPYYNDAHNSRNPSRDKAPAWTVGKSVLGVDNSEIFRFAANKFEDHNTIRLVDQILARLWDKPNAGALAPGVNKVEYKFEVFACCSKGTDCPNWYEGITWKYERTRSDQNHGRPGSVAITGQKKTPSAAFTAAFSRWNANPNHPFTPCK